LRALDGYGFGRNMKGLFDLSGAQDLCKKLEHDYARVKADPSNAFAAYDFVVTAWHLLEWHYPGNTNSSARSALSQQNPILQVCEHLAVGAKHFAPSNPRLDAVAGTERDSVWGKGVWAPGFWAPGVWKDDLVVHLDGAAKTSYGAQLTIVQVADHALDFWKRYGCS
jgi:hypothetical protein